MSFYQYVMKICAEDSPNVQLGLKQKREGTVPTDEILVPGVLTWQEYCDRRAHEDEMEQCIGLDGEFYEGKQILMFPPTVLNACERIAETLKSLKRTARAMGVDPAEGGDKTAMVIVDEMGIIEVYSRKTPNTAMITSETLAMMRQYKIEPRNVLFDRGGGGKQHADRLRQQGYNVRTVGFGESPQLELKRGHYQLEARKDLKEQKYVYKDRRAQMYGDLMLLTEQGFGLPKEYPEVRFQLHKIPKTYDEEGTLVLLPKGGEGGLIELIGHSPDEADALVLAVHGMLHKPIRQTAGVG